MCPRVYLTFPPGPPTCAPPPAGDQAKAEVAEYEKDAAFVAKVNNSAAATKAKAAMGLAVGYEKAGRVDLAKQKYQDIIRAFPNTTWAKEAQAALDEIAKKEPK